ncbi:MAG: hypothetical protein GY740_01620 [Gammaproteobacteria bacterium]|nr:hypothetical protein [Gammaproteobacteria bacterium]
MFLFIVSRNSLSTLVGYDLLGVTSFLLILYYKRRVAINRSNITLIMNKVGDVSLIIALLPSLLGREPVRGLMLLIAAGVKRAQLPWRAWLPLAMAAPTPISALVHSSTLVAAGILVLYKYSLCLSYSVVRVVALSTMFVARLLALIERDMKKVVAYRTMSQIRIIILTIGTGHLLVSLVHLVAHAVFKRLMFLRVGEVLHSSRGAQHINSFLSRSKRAISLLTVRVLSLVGSLFLLGFYSKDLAIEG